MNWFLSLFRRQPAGAPAAKPKASLKRKAAGGAGLSAGVIALSIAMYNHWEGRNYEVVHLPFDPPHVYTVCGGITNQIVPTLKLGQKFTDAECNKMIADLIPKYWAPIQACVPRFFEMPAHRQAALVSFAINLGPARICDTSIGRDLNAGRTREACDAMRKYVLANGKRLQGLVNRRNDPVWGERSWCLRED